MDRIGLDNRMLLRIHLVKMSVNNRMLKMIRTAIS